MVQMLREVMQQHQGTLVVVTHDDRIFPVADRIVRLEDGAVTQDGLGPAAQARVAARTGSIRQLAAGIPAASSPAKVGPER